MSHFFLSNFYLLHLETWCDYPCSGGILYNELNTNYYVTKINVGTLLDLSGILKINDLSDLVDYLFEVVQSKNNN
jgi:hypothetical protein